MLFLFGSILLVFLPWRRESLYVPQSRQLKQTETKCHSNHERILKSKYLSFAVLIFEAGIFALRIRWALKMTAIQNNRSLK